MVSLSANNNEHLALPNGVIEVIGVGESSCLHRADNGAIAILNQDAAWIWRRRSDGLSDIDIARQLAPRIDVSLEQANAHVAALARQLDAAGFLDPPLTVPTAPAKTSDTEASEPSTQHALLAFGFTGQPHAAFKTDDPHLAELVSQNLKPLISSNTAGPFTTITATTTSRGFTVDRDGIAIASDCDLGIVRRVIIQSLMIALLPRENVAAILHASSISIAERGIILAGSTGSGKTTLMMALVKRGAKYLCDDFTALGQAGDRISSFPLAASLKSPSWDLLKRDFPLIDQSKRLQVVNRQVRYVDPAPNDPALSFTNSPSLIVFPEFQAGASLHSRQLSPEESLGMLLTTGSEIVGASDTIESLARLANKTPAIALTYGDLSEAAIQIELMANE
ncbi:MAG: hypothetical protein K0U74_15035 [Alphaproteobacteria bacterium]|nr:hypothetical protein [Alphaproteobacteria bacterium]